MQRQTTSAHLRSLVWIFYGCTPKRTQIHKSQLSPWVAKLKIMTLLSLTWDKLSNLFMPEILTCFRFHPWGVQSAGSLVSGQAKILGLDTAGKIETQFVQLHHTGYAQFHNMPLSDRISQTSLQQNSEKKK